MAKYRNIVRTGNVMERTIAIAGALSDRNRLRALMALRGGELCVCHLIELLRLAPSTVSEHMSILRRAGLVRGRKNRQWMHYSLPGRDADAAIQKALDWVVENTKDESTIREDSKKLRKVVC
jgi:ArsR family transcriptional regulator